MNLAPPERDSRPHAAIIGAGIGGLATGALLAARGYLSMRYGFSGDRPGAMPEWVIEAYMKFVRHGLYDAQAPDRP